MGGVEDGGNCTPEKVAVASSTDAIERATVALKHVETKK